MWPPATWYNLADCALVIDVVNTGVNLQPHESNLFKAKETNKYPSITTLVFQKPNFSYMFRLMLRHHQASRETRAGQLQPMGRQHIRKAVLEYTYIEQRD
jgi:hypothetical protein